MGQEHDSWITGVLGVDVAAIRKQVETVVGKVQGVVERDPGVLLNDVNSSSPRAPTSFPGDTEEGERRAQLSPQQSKESRPTSFPGDTDPPEIEKDWDEWSSDLTNGVIKGAKFIAEKVIIGGIGKLVGVPPIALPIGLESDESPDQRAARKKAEQEADAEAQREAEAAKQRDADFEKSIADRENQRRIDEMNQRLNPIKSIGGDVVRASDESIEALKGVAGAVRDTVQGTADAVSGAVDAGLKSLRENPGSILESISGDDD